MDLLGSLLTLFVACCCALMVELGGVQGVAGSVYVKGGSRYPFPRPQYSNAEAATNAQTNPSSSNKHRQQPSRPYYIESNRRVQRQILNSETISTSSGSAVASIPSLATNSDAINRNSQKQPNTQAVFEDQRPVDFDLNVRPMVHFIPGLKSVMN